MATKIAFIVNKSESEKFHCFNVSNLGTSNLTVHTASLWSLAREKLLRLGELCGLMPGQVTTGDQLHSVITLTGGLPDEEDCDKVTP